MTWAMPSFSIWYAPLPLCFAWFRSYAGLLMCWIKNCWSGCLLTVCRYWYLAWRVSWIRWPIRLFFLLSIRVRRKLPCSWAFMELPAKLLWWWRCLHKLFAMHTSLLSSERAGTKTISRYMRRPWSFSSSLHCWHSWLSCSIWIFCAISSALITGRDCG